MCERVYKGLQEGRSRVCGAEILTLPDGHLRWWRRATVTLLILLRWSDMRKRYSDICPPEYSEIYTIHPIWVFQSVSSFAISDLLLAVTIQLQMHAHVGFLVEYRTPQLVITDQEIFPFELFQLHV